MRFKGGKNTSKDMKAEKLLNAKPKYLKARVCLPERTFGGDVNDKGKEIQHVEPLSSFYAVSNSLLHPK